MALKISQLPAAATSDGTELVPIVQGGATKQTPISALLSQPAGSSLVGFLQSGTGAGSRSGQAKMRDVICVLDFFADGVSGALVDPTGVLDSTLGIQAALNAARAKGAALYFPAGTYTYTSLAITTSGTNAGIVIYGDTSSNVYFGSGTILNCTGVSGNSLTISAGSSAAYLGIRGISFKGNANLDGGVALDNSSFADVEECVFSGYTKATAAALILFANLTYSGSSAIRNSQFQNNAIGILSKGGASGAPQVNSVKYICNNFFDHTVAAIQIGIYGGPTMQARSHTVMGCDFEGNARDILTNATMYSFHVKTSYFENNNALHTSPRIETVYDGVSPGGAGISITRSFFQKTLAAAGDSLVSLIGDNIRVLNNVSSSGNATDRYFLKVLNATNVEAEPAAGVPGVTPYPILISAGAIGTGKTYSSLVNLLYRTKPLFTGTTNPAKIYQGSGPPDNALGSSGDIYINSLVTGANTIGRDALWQKGASFWRHATYQDALGVVPYSASIFPDLGTGNTQILTPTNNSNFTINGTSNTGAGQIFTVVIVNTTGAPLGVCTWNAAIFKLGAAWTQPATGYRRTITFYFDVAAVAAYETSRSPADVPN